MSLRYRELNQQQSVENMYRMCLSSLKFIDSLYAKSVILKLVKGLSQINDVVNLSAAAKASRPVKSNSSTRKNKTVKENGCQTEKTPEQPDENCGAMNLFPMPLHLSEPWRQAESWENDEEEKIIEETIEKYEQIIEQLENEVEELKRQMQLKSEETVKLTQQNELLKNDPNHRDYEELKAEIRRLENELKAKTKDQLKKKMKSKQVIF